MRWQALFDDLEAQAAEADAAELRAEVADRSRTERGRVRFIDRLSPGIGHQLSIGTRGAGSLHGRLVDVGPDWVLLEEPGTRELLIPLSAVLSVSGVGQQSAVPGSEGEVGRRLDLRWALRGLARGRVGVQVVLADGSALAGTLDHVGADHVDVAEHAVGEARRSTAVRQVRLVPLTAIVLVRSG